MNASTMSTNTPSESADLLAAVKEKCLGLWVEGCNDFRRRERKQIIEQEPSPETLRKYRNELKWWLRSGRLFMSLAADPDFPAKQFIPEIEGKLLQLEASWDTLNNPMTEAEADALMEKYFPDEAASLRAT